MFAIIPLVVSLADVPNASGTRALGPTEQPLARHTVDACADGGAPNLAIDATRVTDAWRNAVGGMPWFVVSPACSWKEGGRACRSDHLAGLLRYTCFDPSMQLGLAAPDRDYHGHAHALFGGRMMKVPDDVIRAALDRPFVTDFKRELARLGYRHVEFTSTSVPNPPSGYDRVLVLIEGDDFDQWYQFATTDTRPRVLGRNVDLAVVQKRDERGHKLTPTRFFMNGYSRFMVPSRRWEQEGLGAQHGLNRCIMCHPSGLRGVYPQAGSVAPDEQAALRYVQKKLDSTLASEFGGYYDPTRLGPTMGPIDPPSRPAILSRCTTGMTEAARRRVGMAMNCASCHDGQNRGLLHAGTDWGTIAHKIKDADTEGLMPPGEQLSKVERIVVATCLRMEYAEQLTAWLKGDLPK